MKYIIIGTILLAIAGRVKADECHQERHCYNFGAQCEEVEVCVENQPTQQQTPFCTVIMELQGKCKR